MPPECPAVHANGTALRGLQFGMSDSLGAHNIANALWLQLVAEGSLTRVRVVRWTSTANFVELAPTFHCQTLFNEEALVVRDGAAAHVRREGDADLNAAIAGTDHLAIDALLKELKDVLAYSPPDPADTRVPVCFWSLGAHGPVGRTRTIDVARWDDISGNYPSETFSPLASLLAPSFEPGAGGQLIVWHGDPGTGKTWALRALGWHWRDWCDLNYVTDPETFFGERAAYMLEVLLGDELIHIPASEKKPTDPRARDGRWRLLVLEDTGELLSADARQRSGQGLSRLLNVVDGLIGQGLRILVLLTTNETLRDLHPAVSRPGRCAAHIEFGPFTSDEALRWAREHDCDDIQVKQDRWTLAELYALLAERPRIAARRERAVGFGAGR